MYNSSLTLEISNVAKKCFSTDFAEAIVKNIIEDVINDLEKCPKFPTYTDEDIKSSISRVIASKLAKSTRVADVCRTLTHNYSSDKMENSIGHNILRILEN